MRALQERLGEAKEVIAELTRLSKQNARLRSLLAIVVEYIEDPVVRAKYRARAALAGKP